MRKRGILITLLSTLFLFLAFGLALAATAHAAGPGTPGSTTTPGFPATINYQGMLRQADGKPVTGTHTITVCHLDSPGGGHKGA